MRRETLAPAPNPPPARARSLSDQIELGELGLTELKLTAEEEKVLSEPVDRQNVRIKPQGQPYLPHQDYTRWFNRAFGRTGWSLVPASRPMRSDTSVVCPYVLYIHGQPVAFAMGEQEFHEKNRDQTYGDALEATVASALRRCAKRLGIALELWDKKWLDAFVHEYAILVTVQRTYDQQLVRQWRLRTDPPFWNEVHGRAAAEGEVPQPTQRRATPPPSPNTGDQRPITDPQRKRLWVIIKNSGRNDQEIKDWLARRYRLHSSKDIRRADYQAICAAIEAPGALPE